MDARLLTASYYRPISPNLRNSLLECLAIHTLMHSPNQQHPNEVKEAEWLLAG